MSSSSKRYLWPIWLALGLFVTSMAASSGCSSHVDEQLKLAELAQDCLINSDCAEPYVCAFEACHVECEGSRDCRDGARCISDHGKKVCQFESERACQGDLDCKAGLVCAVDGECRNGCRNDAACLEEQICVSATCADPDELDASGRLTPAAETTVGAEGSPCVYVSDCSSALLCRSQACLPECRSDADCGADQECSGTRCQARGTLPTTCNYSSECEAAGQLCVGKQCRCSCVEDRDCAAGRLCDGCACVADPAAEACRYNSDCSAAGQVCRDEVCACECKADVDCGANERCDGCACVDALSPADGVVHGNVYVGSSLQLARYRGVVEVVGSLTIAGTTFESLGDTFSSLRAVRGPLTLFGNRMTTIAGFPSLKTVDKVDIETDDYVKSISLPLVEGGELKLYSLSSLTSLTVGAWETGRLDISYCSSLKELSFPSLTSAFSIRLGNVPVTYLDFPALLSAQEIGITSFGAGEGATLHAPLLGEVGALSLYATNFTSLGSLLSASGGKLTKADSLSINNNSLLSQCEVDDLAKQVNVMSNGGGNLACPPN
jgi:hypothetical protein